MNYTVSELMMISVLGFMLVFLVLLSLALLTVLFGKLIPAMENMKSAPKASEHFETGEDAGEEDEMEEVLAVLQCVLSEESGIASDELVIQSVRRDEA